MKKYILLLLICFPAIVSFAQETSTFKKKFKDYDKNQVVDTITEGKITLQVNQKSDITKLWLRKLEGDGFDSISIGPKSVVTGFYRYENIKPRIVGGFFEIMMFKGDSMKVVKVKVDKKAGGQQDDAECIAITLPSESACQVRNKENNFGEDKDLYTNNTVVYLYDLNPKKKPTFWKITKEGDTLHTEIVNFNKERIKPYKDLQFRVINVNRFLYDVSVTDELIAFESEPPALLKRMLIGDDTLLAGLMENFEGKIVSEAMDENKKEAFNDLNKKVSCFIQKYNQLQEKMLDALDPCAAFPCCFSVGYLELANDLAQIRNQAGKLQLMMEEEKKNLAAAEKIIADCKKNAEDSKKKSAELAAVKAMTAPTDRAEREKYDKKITDLENDIKTLDGKFKECEPKIKDEEEKVKVSKANLLELSAVTASVASLLTDAELKQTIVFLRNMVDKNSYYSVDFIPLDGNLLNLYVNVVPYDLGKEEAGAEAETAEDKAKAAEDEDDSKGNKPAPSGVKGYKPYKISIPIIWRPFVNFSSGTFATIGRNLQEKTYTWQEVGNGDGYMLSESGYTNPAVGFSAFANVEWKAARGFGIGPSVGVGITIEETPKIAYLLGGSAYFGDKHQLAVTAGMAFMQVDKLSKNFRDAAANQSVYAAEGELDYYKEFKAGFFVSLTYTVFNLTKKN